jgi:hypothetical protein
MERMELKAKKTKFPKRTTLMPGTRVKTLICP